jgi:hypothetical protein
VSPSRATGSPILLSRKASFLVLSVTPRVIGVPSGFADIVGESALSMRLHAIAAFLDAHAHNAALCVELWLGTEQSPKAAPAGVHRVCAEDDLATLLRASAAEPGTTPPFVEEVEATGAVRG